jgi:hypothetical protein
MASLKAQRNIRWLRKKAKKGAGSFPVATIAFYGPDNRKATKVAVSIVPGPDEEPSHLERWFSDHEDLRSSQETLVRIVDFIKRHCAASVAMVDAIIGCPHEEGIDYPEGQSCPRCQFWDGRSRWTDVRRH